MVYDAQVRFTSRYSVSGEARAIISLVSYQQNMPSWTKDPRRHCLGFPTEWFFGDDEGKKVCRGCPVKDQCLEYALEHGELGIWGGTSERERRRLRRLRRNADPG